jgi:hypothetical protein
MTRYLVIGAIIVFWATMMTLVVKEEVAPAWVAAHRPPYRRAPAARSEPPKFTQMAILKDRARLGTYRSVTRRDTDGAMLTDGDVDVQVRVPILRVTGRFDIQYQVRIGPDGRLKRFRAELSSLGLRQVIAGEVNGRELVTTVGEGPDAEVSRQTVDDRQVLVRDLAPLEGLDELRVGDSWFVTSVNPLFKSGPALMQVRERQTIMIAGRPVEVFLVVMTQSEGTTELRAWLDLKGDVVRQELPFGLLLEREPYTQPSTEASRGTNP